MHVALIQPSQSANAVQIILDVCKETRGGAFDLCRPVATFRETNLKRFIVGICLVLGLGLSFTGSVQAQNAERAVPASAVQIQLSFAPLVKQSAPAVVNIFTRAEVSRSPLGGFGDDLFGSPFSRQTEKVQTALGSGIAFQFSSTSAARHATVASYCSCIRNAGLECFGGINFDLGALAIGDLATGIVMTAKMMSHSIKW